VDVLNVKTQIYAINAMTAFTFSMGIASKNVQTELSLTLI